MRVLIIDDQNQNIAFYRAALEKDFELEFAKSLREINLAALSLDSTAPDAIILEVFLEEDNGFTVLSKIREMNEELPCFLISDQTVEENIVHGFKLRASDYIVRPISPALLNAKIQSKIQRQQNTLAINELVVHIHEQLCLLNNKQIALTPIEVKLLVALGRNANRILTREEIHEIIWPNIHVQGQNIDTHISNLRKKLVPFSERIKTIKNRGYLLQL